MIAAELRRQADVFLDIVDLRPKIGRDTATRERHPARVTSSTLVDDD
jgi:uncharacterized LabA/DUF88 family protein